MQDPTGTQTTRALGSRYVLERILGSGAMGQVWLASEPLTGERYAAKLLRQEFTADPGIVARFIQERSILLGLIHPHIVRVRDLVVEGSDLAIVMDLVQGGDLRARLKAEGRLAPAVAVGFAADALEALAAAHAKGILHRDVKPDNLLLDEVAAAGVTGRSTFAKLTDFGIARLAQETTVRMTGLLGTAEYMAPEVLVEETASPAADVYGVGIMLYEMLAGHTPFGGGGNHYAVARRHELALPPQLPVPPVLADTLATMLGKEPTARPPAGELAAHLRRIAPGLAGLSALEAMPSPNVWTATDGRLLTSEHGGRAVAIAGGGMPAADEHQTLIRGQKPVGPVGGGAIAATPSEDMPAWQAALGVPFVDPNLTSLGGEGSQTQLRPGRVRARAVDTLDLVAAEEAARSRWRNPRVLAAIAAVVLLLLGGGAFALLHGSGKAAAAKAKPTPTGPATTTTATADATAAVLPSGLTIARHASLDLSTGTLTTTITYTVATGVSLTGPFYESVPPPVGTTGCPSVVWDQRVPELLDTTLDAGDCGEDIGQAGTTLTSSAPLTASYTEPFAVGNMDATPVVTTYINAEATATSTQLGTYAKDSSFAAQRIVSLDVAIGAAVTQGSVVQLVAAPVWTSGPDATGQYVYKYADGLHEPLAAVIGGMPVLSTDTCSQQLSLAAGKSPYAQTLATGCTITVTVGAVKGTSSAFDIALKGH